LESGAISIDFSTNSSAEANRYAQDLEAVLARLDPSITITRATQPGSQEIVSSLVILFGTPVAGVLAHTLYSWVVRNSGAKLRITSAGEVIAENLNSRDVPRLAEALKGKSKPK
jgi:hypothetical protein